MNSRTEIRRIFRFEAAHSLPNVPSGHRCESVHGHSYVAEVRVSGEIDAHSGWIMDFAAIDAIVAPVVDVLDHAYLNDIDGLENPTSELLARWIWARLSKSLPGLCEIVVSETVDSACSFTGTIDGES